ncbi:hypothetical protein [Bailinhaonella thermotolerans]|uniref:Uncharacterized protein n=1 Tax=Bailinhaonella thermotolerans TaxID=1070861 RepID=A0A3A4B1L1_9ACTN|nr:hypothetical protein [Bailinhaonella thermotolerans]RJL34048.1 hypothetical protein D5H75_05945 [Bailinhaonella thermotolerans]
MLTLHHSLPASEMSAATTANALGRQTGGAAGTACAAALLQVHGGTAGGVMGDHRGAPRDPRAAAARRPPYRETRRLPGA